MNQPQGEASATIEPEPRLPNLTTEDGTHDDAPSADNVTLQDQQPHPLPPNPFLTQPTAETEQHTAIPDRDVNATPPPTAIGAVSVTVRDSHGGEVTFKIKKHTKLNKLMKAFCERQAKTPAQVRFFFDGTRITGDDTPESLDMDTEESIDVYEEQIGGGYSIDIDSAAVLLKALLLLV